MRSRRLLVLTTLVAALATTGAATHLPHLLAPWLHAAASATAGSMPGGSLQPTAGGGGAEPAWSDATRGLAPCGVEGVFLLLLLALALAMAALTPVWRARPVVLSASPPDPSHPPPLVGARRRATLCVFLT